MANNKVMFGGEIIMDLTDASAIKPEDLLEGKSCYDRTGEKITGSSQWQYPTIYKSPISLGDFDVGDPNSYLCHLVKGGGTSDIIVDEFDINLLPTDPVSFSDYITLQKASQGSGIWRITCTLSMSRYISHSRITGDTTSTVRPTSLTFSGLNISIDVRISGEHQTVTISNMPINIAISDSGNTILASCSGTAYIDISSQYYTPTVTLLDITYVNKPRPYTLQRVLVDSAYATEYVIPINNDQDYIRFYIDTDNIFKAQSKNNTISLSGASTALATWGVDIIKVFYLSVDVVVLMWTTQANATTRASVYLSSIDLDGSGNIHSNTTYNRKLLFPSASHKLSWDDTNNVPYVYYGSLYKYNFRDGEWAIGIQYIRASVVSGSITQKYAMFGEIGFYTSASIANRIIMQTAQGSRMAQMVTATPTGSIRDIQFEESHGNVVSALLTTSAGVRVAVRYIYNAVSNDLLSVPAPPWINIQSVTNQTTLDFIDSNTDECRWLGRLDDGAYIIHNVTANKILVCSCRISRTALQSKWNLLTNISISGTDYADLRDTTHRPILLKSGILVGNEYIWQFTYSSGNYGLAKVGSYTRTNIYNKAEKVDNTNSVVPICGHYAIPIGRFSDLAEGIGGADVVADLSTT